LSHPCVMEIGRGPSLALLTVDMNETEGRAPTRLQTRTVCVAPDEVETVHDPALRYAASAEVKAYLKKMGEGDEGTCMGDMVSPGSLSPKVLPAPRNQPSIEPKTVHAYCEPALPFLPVEDLAGPFEDHLDDPLEELYEPRLPSPADDPILEYLQEVAGDSDPAIFPVRTPPPHCAPRPAAEVTMLEQAHVKTSCVSVRDLAVTKRRTPMWAAVMMGLLISILLLTSSVFTVEVLASKLARSRTPPSAPKMIDTGEPTPWVIPR
jgi:hypothetical protein